MKLTKENWVQKGVKLIEEDGYNAIKLENICEKFAVTRGSFYHHFESINEYIIDLLKYWEAGIINGINEISQSNTKEEKIEAVKKFALTASSKAEYSFRVWGIHNAIVREHVQELDKMRITLIVNIYKEMGESEKHVYDLAVIGHVLWLGSQALHIYDNSNSQLTYDLLNTTMKKLTEAYLSKK